MVIKLQAWSPDTCEGTAQNQGCRILMTWDTDDPPATRQHSVAAFERVCAAHADAVPVGVLKWADGNWKPLADYIDYQRAWFRWRNREEWMAKRAQGVPGYQDEPPETVRGYTSEPQTTGSVTAPPQAQQDGMTRVWAWNQGHNARKNQAITIPVSVRAGIDTTRITWSWSGVGDARVLTVNCGGQLTTQQRNQAQSIADAQFGAGLIIVVA